MNERSSARRTKAGDVRGIDEQVFAAGAAVELVLDGVVNLTDPQAESSHLSLVCHFPLHTVMDATDNRLATELELDASHAGTN